MAAPHDDLHDVTILQDATSLTTDDLLEEYDKIASNFVKAKKVVDTYRQKLYQLEREHKLSLQRENDYKEELNIITDSHANELDNQKRQCQAELLELRGRIEQLKSANDHLETENDELKVCASQAPVVPPPTIEVNPDETIVASSRFDTLLELEAKYFTMAEENAMLKARHSELLTNATRTEVNIFSRVFFLYFFLSHFVPKFKIFFSHSFFMWFLESIR